MSEAFRACMHFHLLLIHVCKHHCAPLIRVCMHLRATLIQSACISHRQLRDPIHARTCRNVANRGLFEIDMPGHTKDMNNCQDAIAKIPIYERLHSDAMPCGGCFHKVYTHTQRTRAPAQSVMPRSSSTVRVIRACLYKEIASRRLGSKNSLSHSTHRYLLRPIRQSSNVDLHFQSQYIQVPAETHTPKLRCIYACSIEP